MVAPGESSVLTQLPFRLLVLCFSQAVGSVGLAAGAVAGPLLAVTVTGSASYGPLPLGLLVVGAALSAPTATRLMQRWGRARGLATCYVVATAGAAIVIARGSTGLAALAVGSVLLGTGTAGVMLGRYAAADLVPAEHRARATSLAVTAVTAGAVAGPALLGPAGWLAVRLGLPPATGLYLLAVVAFLLAALIGLRTDRVSQLIAETPTRPPQGPPATYGKPTMSQRLYPLLVLGSANLTMVTVMGAMPTHLRHSGWDLSAIGVVISMHVAVMFGPSPLSGELIRRIGHRQVAFLGSLVMLLAMVLGSGIESNIGLLIALGFGWNLQLLSGSAWVIETTPPHLRYRAEGRGELVMGLAAAVGTLGLAGPLLNLGGLPALCLVFAAATVVVAATFLIGGRR